MGPAFDAWYGAEHPRLVSAITVAAGDVSVAVEAVDEAFARAYARWDRVSAMGSPAGWTYRTALNVLRRRQRRRRTEHQLHRRRTAPPTDAAPGADWSVEVWDALRRLPPRERTAMALRYVADLPVDDIAITMRIAPGTVRAMLHSGRRRLSAALADHLEEARDA
jgi:RNA polymerase sigma-70 factor (ECF subfamily)